MHYILILFIAFFGAFSCVKQPTEDPVPTLQYKDMPTLGKTNTTVPHDTAVMVLRYSDGDGDIFRNTSSDGPNLICTVFRFSADSGKFIIDRRVDGMGGVIPTTITQPANGYYKGKAIHGDIYLPMSQFRSSDNVKLIKFEAFIVDMKNNKSNVVSTPVFTLNF